VGKGIFQQGRVLKGIAQFFFQSYHGKLLEARRGFVRRQVLK